MNKQRKVLITITYNEMGVIIDTKTVELGSSAQPEPCEDTISRQEAIADAQSWVAVNGFEQNLQNKVIEWLKEFPPAQPEQHIDADGTLWITVPDIERVKRVIVEKSTFCRQFYMEEEQHTGKWIPQDHNKRVGNISTCVYYYPTCSKCGQVGNDTYKYCPHCGAKMEGDAE